MAAYEPWLINTKTVGLILIALSERTNNLL